MAQKVQHKKANRVALFFTLSILVAIFLTVISLQQTQSTTQYAASPTVTPTQ